MPSLPRVALLASGYLYGPLGLLQYLVHTHTRTAMVLSWLLEKGVLGAFPHLP